MKVLLIDNFDSFVYNLAQYIGSLGAEPVVIRNNVAVDALEDLDAQAVVVSPGPGHPTDAGCSVEAIRRLGPRIPLLGVCLGHQAIAVAFGGEVVRARRLMHGKTSMIEHSGAGIFEGLPSPFEATRYHSLVVEPEGLPPELQITASTSDGVIMGLSHAHFPIYGVQFHPESILTTVGMDLIAHFLESVG